MVDELAGLFGHDHGDGQSEDDLVGLDPEGMGALETNFEETSRLNPKVRASMINKEFSRYLDSEWGRDDLAEYVWNQLEGEYDSGTITELQIYLLDELDIRGGLRGKFVLNRLREFREQDGNPDYPRDFDYRP